MPPRRLARRAGYRTARRTTAKRTRRKVGMFSPPVLITGAIIFAISQPAVGITALLFIGVGLWYTRPGARYAWLRQRGSVRRRNRAVRDGSFLALSPTQFEHALADLCRRDGCTNVRVVGGAGDLGADIICTTPTGKRLVIQAKRYAPTTKVGSGDVQKVGGTARQIHGADIAAVVTTSTFTPAAADYCRKVGIRMFDGSALARWASNTGSTPWR